MADTPKHSSYDVVIIGGAMYGSSVAWWLSQMAGFQGRVLVVERDPSYEFAATSHTNSCIRQQFSNRINVGVSQFGAEFIRNFRTFMGGDPDVPELALQSYGYMYLADTEDFADTLRESQAVQAELGAATKFMTADEIAAEYPFYMLDDIIGANHNLVNEGYFDGGTMFDWFRRMARRNGVEYIQNEVVDITRTGNRIDSVTLKSGEVVGCGAVVNSAGTRGVLTAKMAGFELPIEPRRRYTYIFDAAKPLDRDLPLTIDPSGVHMRTDGRYYLAGGPPDDDPAVDFDHRHPHPAVRGDQADQHVGRALRLQHARSERDCRPASRGQQLPVPERIFRARIAAVPGARARRGRDDRLWRIPQPRPHALLL